MGAREYYDYRRAIYGDITHKAILVDVTGTLLAPTEPMAQNTRTFEHRAISTSECFDFISLPHNLLGLHFKQKRCNCVNESCNEKECTTIFHSVDVGVVQTTESADSWEILLHQYSGKSL